MGCPVVVSPAMVTNCDTPPLSNVLNVPVGQEEPAGQEIVTLLTSKLDHEVDVVNEQDPDRVG